MLGSGYNTGQMISGTSLLANVWLKLCEKLSLEDCMYHSTVNKCDGLEKKLVWLEFRILIN
jgi:hypothetical protein